MCGLWGCFGSGIMKADLGALYTLAFLNQQRGMHSTGVARIWNSKERPVEIRKDTIPAMYFLGSKENRTILEDVTPVAIMGHNRHATVGASGDARGAHPFETSRYVGFHNGTLLEDKYTIESPFFTDSEALYNDITERGISEVLPPLYKDSAFALAYYDKEVHRIGFIRNEKRPLAFAACKDRDVVFYSSDMLDLEYAMDKHNIVANIYRINAWKKLEADPRSVGFIKREEDETRTNTWFIEEVTPKPLPEPKNNVYDYFSYGRYTGQHNNRGDWSLKCKICDDKVKFAKHGESKSHDPVWVKNYGYVCNKCDTMLENNFGIDIRDDDADAYIGAYIDQRKQVIIN